jgi:hypothetical protein
VHRTDVSTPEQRRQLVELHLVLPQFQNVVTASYAKHDGVSRLNKPHLDIWHRGEQFETVGIGVVD